MLNTKPITINIPPGPYPDCGGLDEHGLQCHGTLMPKVEPATVYESYGSYGKQKWVEDSVVLYWQCNRCGKRA